MQLEGCSTFIMHGTKNQNTTVDNGEYAPKNYSAWGDQPTVIIEDGSLLHMTGYNGLNPCLNLTGGTVIASNTTKSEKGGKGSPLLLLEDSGFIYDAKASTGATTAYGCLKDFNFHISNNCLNPKYSIDNLNCSPLIKIADNVVVNLGSTPISKTYVQIHSGNTNKKDEQEACETTVLLLNNSFTEMNDSSVFIMRGSTEFLPNYKTDKYNSETGKWEYALDPDKPYSKGYPAKKKENGSYFCMLHDSIISMHRTYPLDEYNNGEPVENTIEKVKGSPLLEMIDDVEVRLTDKAYITFDGDTLTLGDNTISNKISFTLEELNKLKDLIKG